MISWCFLDLFFHLVIHFVVLVLLVLALMDLTLVHVVVLVDILPVLIVVDLASIGLILATSRQLLILVISVDSLHHNVPTLWIDPVVVVDVPLERNAENPP